MVNWRSLLTDIYNFISISCLIGAYRPWSSYSGDGRVKGVLPHQLKLSIRWNETYCSVCIKFTEFDTLVELAIFKCYRSSCCPSSLCASLVSWRSSQTITVKEKSVIESKFALWNASQVGTHYDLTSHIFLQYSSFENNVRLHPLSLEMRFKYLPVALMSRLTSSITSTKASFLRYRTSALLHDRAPVACIVICDEFSCLTSQYTVKQDGDLIHTIALSDLTPSVVMYILSVSVSVFWG